MAIRDENGVPVLALSADSKAVVVDRHLRTLDPEDDSEQFLVGAVVLVENKRPVGAPDVPDVTTFTIGGETVDEAAKSVVGTFDDFHGHDNPGWVASSDPHLAEVLAEHYNCEIRSLSNEEIV